MAHTPSGATARRRWPSACMALVLPCVACAGQTERSTTESLGATARELSLREPSRADPRDAVPTDGRLEGYLVYAARHSPALRASFERWRAAAHAPARARKLPDPTITYAAFLRSVETRVGPQQHKLGVMQWFPWPSAPSARGEAAARAALAEQRRFEADALALSARVTRAYYELWLVARTREVRAEQQIALEGVAEQLRARLEVGRASLADVSQLELSITRLADAQLELDEARQRAQAELRRVIGAPPTAAIAVDASLPPATGMPAESEEALRAEAMQHPRVAAFAEAARGQDERARAEAADGLPSFGLGAEWIVTGESGNPMVRDDGKDPIVVMFSLRLPLWRGAHDAAEEEAHALAAQQRALEADAEDQAATEVTQILSQLRDADRRFHVYRSTLVPQAESVFESSVQSYQSGGASLANVLLAERDLLALRLDELSLRATHAVAWARLENAVGRALARSGEAER